MDKQWKQYQTLFFVWFSKITADGDCSHVIKRCLPLGRKVMTNLDSIFGEGNGNLFQYSCLENPRDGGAWWAAVYGVTQSQTWQKRLSDLADSILKSIDITLSTKVRLVKAMVFSSSRVWMWELGYKESWTLKNQCFWTVVLEKTLESPFDSKEIQPVHPKGHQSWIFIGRADAKVELQYFGHMMRRDDSLEKTLMLGKIEGRRRRG